MKPRTTLERMPRLDVYVRGRAHLVGDLARLDALRDATDVLDRLGDGAGRAGDHHRRTQDRHEGVRRGVRYLVKKIDARVAYPILPEFHRTPKADDPAADTPAD